MAQPRPAVPPVTSTRVDANWFVCTAIVASLLFDNTHLWEGER